MRPQQAGAEWQPPLLTRLDVLHLSSVPICPILLLCVFRQALETYEIVFPDSQGMFSCYSLAPFYISLNPPFPIFALEDLVKVLSV